MITLEQQQQARKDAETYLEMGMDIEMIVGGVATRNRIGQEEARQIVEEVEASLQEIPQVVSAPQEQSAQVQAAENVPEWETPAHTEIDPFDPEYDVLVAAQEASNDPLPLVPSELKAKPNWVRWKLETIHGRPTKVPYQLNGNKASSTDSATWNTYEAIVNGAVINETQGVGIMTDGSFVGFDLDGCRNPATGEIAEWARRVINTLGTYTEITPSGYGVRVYATGQLPDGARRFSLALSAGFGNKVGIECYGEKRYFTVTGSRVGDRSGLQSSNVAQAHQLCAGISREFPSEKRVLSASFGADDGGSSVVFAKAPGMVFTTKLAVMMYGKITSKSPFEIQDEHGNKVTAPSQSEADMSLATLLAMKHRGNRELIDQDFRESSLYRPKWDRLSERTITKAIESAKRVNENAAIEIPATAQAQAAAVEAPQDVEPFGETIPEFDDTVITGSFRKLVDAVCNGTTIPRQYALHATKVLACSILTKYKIELEDCESARTYFIVFGDTGTGKGLSFRRVQKIIDATRNVDEYLRIIHAVDSEAGLRDAFFEIPTDKNRPILYFVDEIKTLGHKADGKKNPEIVDSIIELANNPTISRTKSKKNQKSPASKTREDSWLLLYACAQDGEAYGMAFPRTKVQGLPDRFIPEYSPKVKAGRLPEPDMTAGMEAVAELLKTAHALPGRITMSAEVKKNIEEIWNSQPEEFQQSPRLRQQFMLEMYLAAFSRGSAVAEQQDLAVAVKALDRQKAIRGKFFAEEIPNQVGVYSNRLKAIRSNMQRRLRRGVGIGDVALSLPQLMTQTLAYKENDLPTFNQAWKAMTPFFLKCNVTSKKNGHVYEKFVPRPDEDDTWLPPELVNGKALS
jgi:putative DNA primase/helicase